MEKEFILQEIQRIARESEGKSPGWRFVESSSSIRKKDWEGVYWARWNDALEEAGLAKNQLTQAYAKDELLLGFLSLARELGRVPAEADIRFKSTKETTFPNSRTISKRFGSKRILVEEALAFCIGKPDFSDVAAILGEYVPRAESDTENGNEDEILLRTGELGYVYLMRSGKHYKIGRTNAIGRREYEIAIQLPERLTKEALAKLAES